MIGAAYQQGIFVQVISSEGQILFTQKGKLLRCSSEVVSFLKGNDLFICDHQGMFLLSCMFIDLSFH